MAFLWRINSIASLYWKHWEEGYVLFNATAAQTHMLNDIATAVLRLLQQAPHSMSDLSKQLTIYFDMGLDDSAQIYLQRLLRDLDDLGLIEPYIP